MDAKHYTTITDPGKERELNEDNHGTIALPDGVLFIVCDGMGGHEGGEVASKLAVEAIGQIFVNSPSTDPAEKLMNGFRVANQRILSTAEKNGTEGMGTTAVAACVQKDHMIVAHVGDSRAYLVRSGELVWKTKDHTRVRKMVERGILTEEQAKTHPDANVVTRALGYRETADGEPIEPEISERVDLEPGDMLLLATDGLFDLVTDDEIASESGTPDKVTRKLVDMALDRGGHDNITVSVLVVPGTKSASTSVNRPASVNKKPKERTTDLEDAPVSVSRTKSRERVTDLDETASPERKRAAAVAAAVDKDAKRRKIGALVMFGVAALLGVAIYVLMSGDDAPTASGAPAPQPGATPIDAGDATAPSDPGGAAVGSDQTIDPVANPIRPGAPKPVVKRGSGAGSGSADPQPEDPYAGSAAGSGAGSASVPKPVPAAAKQGSGTSVLPKLQLPTAPVPKAQPKPAQPQSTTAVPSGT